MANILPDNPSGGFTVFKSCYLTKKFLIKIGSLEGERVKPTYRELLADPLLRHSGAAQEGRADLKVTCQIFENGKPIIPFPVETAYKSFSTRWSWNEWLNLPILISELPRQAVLAFTIWDTYGPNQEMAVGGTTISVFGKNGLLREGHYDLKVWPKVEADGKWDSSTPGHPSSDSEEMNRLSKATKKHHSGQMQKCEWLDRQTFRIVEQINESTKKESKNMFLMVEFPKITLKKELIHVIYFEEAPNCPNCQDFKDTDKVLAMALGKEKPTRKPLERDICPIFDPEVGMENLVEGKHHKLARSLRSGNIERDLKPNASARDQLNAIMDYPTTKSLAHDEEDLVWKYRFYLKSNKKALPKFLRCITWGENSEAKQAIELLREWQPMDVEDALELLSLRYLNRDVRRYAVARLQDAPNEDLMLYLLQLVQALKYETIEVLEEVKDSTTTGTTATTTTTPKDKPRSISSGQESRGSRMDSSASTVGEAEEADSAQLFTCDLVTFLINRACANSLLTNNLYWYLEVEIDSQEGSGRDKEYAKMYQHVQRRFLAALEKSSPESLQRKNELARQKALIDKLSGILRTVAKESGNRTRKIEKLQALLKDQDLVSFEPMSFPLDPSVKICGIRWDKASLFKSSQMPCLLQFLTTTGVDYLAIFKIGDDLRQDQLVLQTISLMDKILRKENVILKLTPYRVLATSRNSGFVQYVEDSYPVADVLKQEETILNFFRKHAPCETGPYGVTSEIMDNYVRSVAGYCVITYVLGVGDRHLDNLLLTKKGHLFHIDFGFILGRDPKPYAPPMKLCKEMVEGMGGEKSENFMKCKDFCVTAFLQFRRHANVILNLFALMVDSSIHDIALESDKTVGKVQEKLLLDEADEKAVRILQDMIDESVSGVMASFVEKIHTFAQYWKK